MNFAILPLQASMGGALPSWLHVLAVVAFGNCLRAGAVIARVDAEGR